MKYQSNIIRNEAFYKEEHPRWNYCPVCNHESLCMCMEFESFRWFVLCDNCGTKTPPRNEKQQAWHDMKDKNIIIPESKTETKEKTEETGEIEEMIHEPTETELFEDDGVDPIDPEDTPVKQPHKKGKARR